MALEKTKQSLAQTIADSGMRTTSNRELIYEVLLRRHDHPTADEIYLDIKTVLPSISLATVYNGLEALVSHGLIRPVRFERGSTRYCSNLKPHAHFRDESTGQTHDIEISPDLLEQLKNSLPEGYEFQGVEVTFHGKMPKNN